LGARLAPGLVKTNKVRTFLIFSMTPKSAAAPIVKFGGGSGGGPGLEPVRTVRMPSAKALNRNGENQESPPNYNCLRLIALGSRREINLLEKGRLFLWSFDLGIMYLWGLRLGNSRPGF